MIDKLLDSKHEPNCVSNCQTYVSMSKFVQVFCANLCHENCNMEIRSTKLFTENPGLPRHGLW